MPPATALRASTDLVAVAWIASVPGLTASGVATQLPADETKWAAGGFIVVPATVGGSPSPNNPIHKPVCQVEFWATVAGSDKLPWGMASQLAQQVQAACWDRTTFGRPLAITAGGVAYPPARVLSAVCRTEPRRIWSDAGDYAGFSMDLGLTWVAAGEEVR